MHQPPADPNLDDGPEWFAKADPGTGERGLRFSCTMCGNCCTGPEGYVLVSDAEAEALARRLGLTVAEFFARYTHRTIAGRSLIETASPYGFDCVFLDREKIPGRAVCGVYEDRPAQCRTWPFWKSNLHSRARWERAGRKCPGIGTGPRYTVQQVRIERAKVEI